MSVCLWTKQHLARQKLLKTRSFWRVWLPNLFRATTACTFSTSKRHLDVHKWPEHVVILTCPIKMCFAPQRRALFGHVNSQKWSGPTVFCTFSLQNILAPQRRALFQHRNFQKWSEHGVLFTFSLAHALRATTAYTFWISQFPKVVREWCAFYSSASICASRHNGVHFFHISTSKSAPRPTCFDTFGFKMCFAPQRRALFRHLNFQKSSEHEVFGSFYFQMFFMPQRRAIFHPSSGELAPHPLSYLFALLHLLSSYYFRPLFSSPFWLIPRPSSSCLCFFLAVLFHPSILSGV